MKIKMKHKIFKLFVSLAVALGFSSCNERWEPGINSSDDKGTLSTESISLDITNAEEVVRSRAGIDISNYIVTVTNSDGIVVNEWKFGEMPGLPMFAVGNYTLGVKSHTPKRAAWNEPYFVGSKAFTIVKDEITNIGAVECKLQNVKVTVNFAEDLVKASDGDISCEVRVNKEGVLTYTPATTESGYFEYIPGNFTMVVTFTGTVNGYKENIIRTYTDLKAGQHRIINFTLKTVTPNPLAETGQWDPTEGLNVNMDVEDSDLSGNVETGEDIIDDGGKNPGEEEWPDDPDDPKPDDPTPPDNPQDPAATFTNGVNKDGEQSNLFLDNVTENDPNVASAVVMINCPKGVAHLNVKIESDNDEFKASAGEMMPLEFDLADSNNAQYFTGLLPVGDEVVNQTEVKFDISELAPLLAGFPGHHVFYLEVVDNAGNKSNLILKFKA